MAQKTTLKANIIYRVFLIITTVIIWWLVYSAQFYPYDYNYAQLIYAFIVSIISVSIIFVIWFKWRHITQQTIWQTSIFLLLNSPVTIIIVVFNYEAIFSTLSK